MDEFKRLANSRRGYRIHLRKLISKAADLIERHHSKTTTSDIPSLTDLCDLRDQLRRKDELISALDTEIVKLIDGEDDLVTEVCEAEEIKESISTKIAHISRIIDTLQVATVHETIPLSAHPDTSATRTSTDLTIDHTPSASVERPPTSSDTPPHTESPRTAAASYDTMRLPKLSIPTFAGDALQWQSFWDCFEAAVHRNPSITGVQKLNYLRAQLQGTALRVIAGFPLTNENYNHSIALLKERYGDIHKLTDAHMQALVELKNPSNTLSSLQSFYDSVESHVRSLQSLGTSQEMYGSMLVPIILTKLPTEVRRNIARSHGTEKWTLSELQSSVLQELKILEMGADYSNNLHTPTAAFFTKADHRQPHRQQSSQPIKKSCSFCKSTSHSSLKCDIITDTQKRIAIVKKENLCFNCLGHHRVQQCQSKYRCKICKRKHHTSLCDATITQQDSPPEKSSNTTATNSNAADTTTSLLAPITPVDKSIHNLISPGVTKCLLKTAVANVRAGRLSCSANILFDEGAQQSFISQALADQLNIRTQGRVTTAISSFGGTSTLSTLPSANIELITKSGEGITLSVLIIPKIATPLKMQSLLQQSVQGFTYLQELDLAHPITHNSDFEITLLIGADFYWTIVQNKIIRGDGPTAVQSKLGYLLSGPLPSSENTRDLQIFHTAIHPIVDSFNISKFWDVESAGTLRSLKSLPDNSLFASYLMSSISRAPDGSFVAKFPWKDNHPTLPSNRSICEGRARSLARKLSRTPGLMIQYGNIIADQMKRGFIEQVDASYIPQDCHFIPHHPVRKDSTTTPLRIVYDCSCRQSPTLPSLNDCLQAGPPFINDLCAILLRFRTHSIGIVTDIEKAFLHVHLAEEDRHYTYFVWLSQPTDPESEFIIYRFRVVLFGSVSSPFMLNATLYKLLLADGSDVAENILQNIYVDNVVSGFSNVDAAMKYYHKSREIMSTARFNLRSWASNHSAIMSLAQQDKIADNRSTVNVLGLLWNTDTDTLHLNPKEPMYTLHSLITKRDVLKDVSRLYDPLGFITPITMLSKVFLQELWQHKLHWDEPLPDNLRRLWLTIAISLQSSYNFSIPRHYSTPDGDSRQLHVFVDASKKGYGAVAYLCSNKHSSFVMSKTRVAPIKEVTLPKLELRAAVIGTRLLKFMMHSMLLIHSEIPVYMWSDSQITLYWIYSSKRLPQFVSHRVAEIKQSTPATTWKYCPTSDNPADLLTRGLSTEQFNANIHMWMHGPTWLHDQQQWPTWHHSSVSHLHAVAAVSDEFQSQERSPFTTGIHQIFNILNYSKLNRLLSATAYVFRFIFNLLNPKCKLTGPLTANEMNTARIAWVRNCQRVVYWKELASLTGTSQNKKQPLLIRQLRLTLDKEGIIRCGGRIHNAPLSELARFPYLLPPKHQFTTLIVSSVHSSQYHGGVIGTLTAIRQNYWIPKGRQCVKAIIRRCITCKKQSGKPYSAPDPPPLPKIRTLDAPPFTVTGVDFTGALYVRFNSEELKVYICLFTCAATRAVHLEIVTDLTTETFLLAFRRFASRKSLPKIVISDNASTYMSAATELYDLFNSKTLATHLGRQGVEWKFIPKRAPWFGGFWERLIGLTKTCLKKVLGRAHVTLATLETMVVEIEAVLNDRPLTYLSDDIQDLQPLTPSHLLYGRRITRVPHEQVSDVQDGDYGNTSDVSKRARVLAHVLEHFRNRWKQEYLTSLREFHKQSGNNIQEISVGDIVLVHNEEPRIQWKLAVIEKLNKGQDGLIRSADIRTSTGTTNRPIVKLYPLEVQSSSVEPVQNAPEHVTTSVPQYKPSTRTAAKKATQQISEWAKLLRAPPEDVGE